MRKKPPPLTVVGSTETTLSPERKLGPDGLAMWNAITSAYDISDAGGIAVLMQVCFAKDRIEQCMAQIEADGCVIYTKAGAKSHPLLRDELALRSFIVRGLTKLGLNVETIKAPGRPPGSWSGRG